MAPKAQRTRLISMIAVHAQSFVLLTTCAAVAQEPQFTVENPLQETLAILDQLSEPVAPSPGSLVDGDLQQSLPQDRQLSDETVASYEDALRHFYQHDTWRYDFRRRIYEWQLLASRIIFLVVNAIVFFGIYLSWLQFRATSQTLAPATNGEHSRGAEGEANGGADQDRTVASPVHHFRASMRDIEISSPVLGVVILAMSFVFYYLYLHFVYPIH